MTIRTLIVITALSAWLAAGTTPAAEPQSKQSESNRDKRLYDASGNYLGRQTHDGRQYDRNNRYTGRIDKNGRRYDANGKFLGQERR